MNAERIGLYHASDFAGLAEDSWEAKNAAWTLVAQASELTLICAVALDDAACGIEGKGYDPGQVAAIASRLMFKCSEDLNAAAGLIS